MRPFCLVSCARLSRPFCAGCRIARISDGLVTDGPQTRSKSDSKGTVMTPSRATVRVLCSYGQLMFLRGAMDASSVKHCDDVRLQTRLCAVPLKKI